MYKIYLIVLISFLSANLIAQQEKPVESYQLNPKESITNRSISCKMTMQSTKQGTLGISMADQNIQGIINLFKMEVETKDIYKKDTITREFIKKRRKTITELNGQVMIDGDESGIEGKTAIFTKEKGNWKLQNGSDFSAFGLKYLNEFYDPTKKESEIIIYPDNLKVGETRKLTDKNFPKPSQAGETNTGSGTVKLVSVEKIDGERIAILELDLETESLNKIEKDEAKTTTHLKGVVRRSLDTFVDIDVNLDCAMNMVQSKYTEGSPNAIISMVVTGKMEASCEVLD